MLWEMGEGKIQSPFVVGVKGNLNENLKRHVKWYRLVACALVPLQMYFQFYL